MSDFRIIKKVKYIFLFLGLKGTWRQDGFDDFLRVETPQSLFGKLATPRIVYIIGVSTSVLEPEPQA